MEARTIRTRIEIRRATDADAPMIVECTSAALWRWTRTIGRVPGLPVHPAAQGTAPHEVWLASVGGVSTGLIALGVVGSRMWIDCVAVFPRYTRVGIGRSLLAHAERTATRRGCATLHVQVHPMMTDAIGWFTRCGFARLSGLRPRHPVDGPTVVMRKRPAEPEAA